MNVKSKNQFMLKKVIATVPAFLWLRWRRRRGCGGGRKYVLLILLADIILVFIKDCIDNKEIIVAFMYAKDQHVFKFLKLVSDNNRISYCVAHYITE